MKITETVTKGRYVDMYCRVRVTANDGVAIGEVGVPGWRDGLEYIERNPENVCAKSFHALLAKCKRYEAGAQETRARG